MEFNSNQPYSGSSHVNGIGFQNASLQPTTQFYDKTPIQNNTQVTTVFNNTVPNQIQSKEVNVPKLFYDYNILIHQLKQPNASESLYYKALSLKDQLITLYRESLPLPSPLLQRKPSPFDIILHPQGQSAQLTNTYYQILFGMNTLNNLSVYMKALAVRDRLFDFFRSTLPELIRPTCKRKINDLQQGSKRDQLVTIDAPSAKKIRSDQAQIENQNNQIQILNEHSLKPMTEQEIQQCYVNLHNRTKEIKFDYIEKVDDFNESKSTLRNDLHKFKDINCAKLTAVPLSSFPFYLHANQMTKTTASNEVKETGLPFCSKEFVASQLPLPKVQYQFWTKIFENDALIIDLTKESDIRHPGEYYYSDRVNDPLDYDNEVIIKLIKTAGNYRFYNVTVGKETKQITRYHFDQWPDHGVITVPQLKALVEVVKNANQKTIWTHCRGGVGRTGTLIAAFLVNEGILNGNITYSNLKEKLIQIILDLRMARSSDIIQSKDQFALLVRYAEDLLQNQQNG